MKKIISMLAVAMVATVGTTYAQYGSDGLRFSQTNYGSTARFKGMGNAQIGVGGDMSSLGGNPAGLGLFTRSEFAFTPEFNQTGVDGSFLGTSTKTDKSHLNINQLGAVFYTPSLRMKGQDTQKGVVSTVFGLGYTRNNDYALESNFGGVNNNNSIRNYFAELANRYKDPTDNSIEKNSLEGMAYESYLINFNTPGNANTYTANSTGNPFTASNQSKNEIRSGSVSEFNFAGAINISNQVYIGANIGLVSLRYTSDAEFTESSSLNPYDQTDGFTGVENYSLSYLQNQETRGSGVNGRLGVIFRPVSSFRIGATLQTPTWFTIDDTYSETLNNKLSNDVFTNKAMVYDFTYNLRTPLKGSLGASYIIGGQGIISADVDFIDYSSIRFSTNGSNGGNDAINTSNAAVRNNYTSAVNYRIGGEYKIENISLRAGYGLNGSPYKNDDDKLFETKMYSGGLGYRVNNYYFDLAYQRVETNGTNSPYTLNSGSEPMASSKFTNNNFFLTFGIRF
ncbi:hypothetical protein [Pedobacter sp. UBA4863]|uniref:OmpP1/FadL family transporter n=1 Tax=Pedobacter sp. UBA4863 TaxID=1947060 RepID=UPI0025D831ED|nr:hypothetical protein [Pedobacter sp. UBA4863]